MPKISKFYQGTKKKYLFSWFEKMCEAKQKNVYGKLFWIKKRLKT